ncbi:MAG: hypothetical protein WD716_02965 [Fimbriimonadaceae bacterium]
MDTTAVRPRWRATLMRKVTPRLQLGIEANLAAEEFGPLLNWIVTPETTNAPMVTFGTSSDRIFSPKGEQSYYLTAAKGIPGTAIAPYMGLSWSTWEDRLLFPAGVNVALGPQWDLMQMYDGRNSHTLVTYKTSTVNYSLILVKERHIGFSVGVGF